MNAPGCPPTWCPISGPSQTSRTAIVLCHIALFPCIQGNRVVVRQLLGQLRAAKYRVILVMPAPRSSIESFLDAYRDVCDELHVVEPGSKWGAKHARPALCAADRGTGHLDAVLEHLCTDPTVQMCIAQYIHLASSLAVVPDHVRTAVMTHDVLHRLADQKVNLPAFRQCTAEQETMLLRHAHVIIAINAVERSILKTLIPDRKAIEVGLAVESPRRSAVPDDTPPTILFTGSGNPMNVDGVSRFLTEAWPQVHAAVPDSRLLIAGGVCEMLEDDSAPSGVTMLGIVDDLDACYDRAHVVINCTIMGTGLKIKCIEALGCGKALVTTANGAEGLPGQPGRDYIVTETIADMAAPLIELLNTPDRVASLARAAFSCATDELEPAKVYQPLLEALSIPAQQVK